MFCILFTLCALPIVTVKVPPLVDYPNHLARMYIITNPASLSKYFYIHWQIIPNLGADAVIPLIGTLTNIFWAGKLFILSTMLLTVSGTFAIHYVLFQKWSGPILSFLFLFNGIFLYGFLNYSLAIGIALWATAGWIALRNRFWLARAIFSTFAVLVLFFCHFGGVALYALALFCYELSLLIGRRWLARQVFVDASVMGAPFLIVIPLIMTSPTSHEWAIGWPRLDWKWKGPYLVLKSGDLLLDGIFACFIILFVGYLIYSNRLTMSRLAWIFLSVSSIIYLIIPDRLFGATILDIRLPAAFVFFLIALMRWRIDSPRAMTMFYGIITVVLLVRLIGVAEAWQAYQEIAADYEKSFTQIKPGTRVLVTQDATAGWRGSGNRVTAATDMSTTMGLPALAVIERSCFVSELFADPGQQILVVRAPYRDSISLETPLDVRGLNAPSEGTALGHPYISDWRNRFDYVYVLYAPPGSQPSVPDAQLLYQGRSFQLYQVSRPQRSSGRPSPLVKGDRLARGIEMGAGGVEIG